MKEVKYFADFTADGCSGESTRAMQVLGGEQWVEVYEEADR
jgi:hypothetical protein